MEEIGAELGGLDSLSANQRYLLEQAALIRQRLEHDAVRLILGEPVDRAAMQTDDGRLHRILRDLSGTAPRRGGGPSGVERFLSPEAA